MMRWSRQSLISVGTAGLLIACAVGSVPTLFADGNASDSAKSSLDPAKKDAAKNVEKRPAIAKPVPATKSEKASPNAKTGVDKPVASKVSPEREQAAIAFAGQHHPELATLLSNLKQNNPSEFREAVAELDRTVDRLESLKAKNAALHDSELKHWKLNSRIRLMAARLTMADNPALEAELKSVIREKVELTLEERKLERDRLQKRLEKLDQSIGELSDRLDETTERELATVKRSFPSNKANQKTKPAKKGDEHAAAKPTSSVTDATTTPKKKPNEGGGSAPASTETKPNNSNPNNKK